MMLLFSIGVSKKLADSAVLRREREREKKTALWQLLLGLWQ